VVIEAPLRDISRQADIVYRDSVEALEKEEGVSSFE
jgi:hypothetical protein